LPSKPQVEAAAATQAVSLRGVPPATTKVHVPAEPGAEQVLQASVHAVPQQTLSTQKLLAQSAAHSQACPAAFFAPASPLHATSGDGDSAGTSRPSAAASRASR